MSKQTGEIGHKDQCPVLLISRGYIVIYFDFVNSAMPVEMMPLPKILPSLGNTSS
jgi:hypothetical protein